MSPASLTELDLDTLASCAGSGVEFPYESGEAGHLDDVRPLVDAGYLLAELLSGNRLLVSLTAKGQAELGDSEEGFTDADVPNHRGGNQ